MSEANVLAAQYWPEFVNSPVIQIMLALGVLIMAVLFVLLCKRVIDRLVAKYLPFLNEEKKPEGGESD